MSTVVKIEEIAVRLQDYQEQMTALNEALDALKKVGELISSAMAEDRAALIGIALQMQDEAEVVGMSSDVSATEAAQAIETIESFEIVAAADGAADEAPSSDTEPDVSMTPLEPVTAEALATLAAAASAGSQTETNDLDADVVAASDAQVVAFVESAASKTDGDVTTMTEAPVETVEAPSVPSTNVVDLAKCRRKPLLPLPSRRRGLGFAAALLMVALGGTVIQEIAQGDLIQRLVELGSCDGDAVAANRDCALLAWMLL